MAVEEQHRAEADVRQSIARHRALRAISRGWVIGFTVAAVMNAALVHGAYFLVPLALAVLAAAFAVRESRTVRRLDAELAGPAEPPQTHAEAVAEAVEARRQQQWDAIAERAYRATGGQVDRPAPRPPELRPGAAYDVSTTLDRDGYSGTAPVRSASPCAHKNAVPVDLLVTGERVAWTCPDCPARLPADWRS
jgi:hypothetical protein